MPKESADERAAQKSIDTFRASGFGYFMEQATRPQTIGYALLDSRVAMAAWMLDHDTDSYYIDLPRLRRWRAGGWSHPRPHPRQRHAVPADGHRASAARSYWENGRAAALASGQAPPDVSLPVGFTTFPDETFAVPHSWVEASYPHVSYFNKVDREGHFAACEEPELFSSKVRARVQLTPLIATTTRGRAGRAQIWFDRHASEMRGGSI